MIFTLPLPPGINKTYKVGKGRMYKSKVARDWEDTAGYVLLKQTQKLKKEKGYSYNLPLLGGVMVGVKWFYRYKPDVDFGIKILLDLLEKIQVYKNDNQVDEIMYMKRIKDVKNPRVEVIVYEKH